MAITQDAFGNTFAGNYLAGDAWEPNDLLSCIRTALGSNDRANINRASIESFRIDWRPNEITTDETRTGIIPAVASQFISATAPQPTFYTLSANSRMAFSQWDGSNSTTTGVYLMETGLSNVRLFPGSSVAGNYTTAARYWAVATDSNLCYFVKEGSTSFFLSQGIAENSGLTFPNNIYSLALRTDTANNRIFSDFQSVGTLVPMFASTAVANYAHIQKSDEQPTTDEVELYLRRQSDNAQLGFVPNVFKVKIEAPNTAPAIGDIVRLDLAEAQSGSFYFNQGNIFCIVVGRLGNTSETDLTGDYLLMRVAG